MHVRFFEFTGAGVGVWYLPVLGRIFLLLLLLVSIYSLYSTCIILVRLRSLSKQRTFEDKNSLRRSLALLKQRAANLRQLILASFHLFGLTFFSQITTAFVTPLSGPFAWVNIAQHLEVHFNFAADAFLVFLILHMSQWVASTRIRSLAFQLQAD